MNGAPSIAVFSIVVGIIFLSMDLYVLRTWTKFSRKHNLNLWWRRLPWILAGIFAALYVFVALQRQLTRLEGFNSTLFGLVSLWYLPKLAIVPILLVKDLLKGARALVQRLAGGSSKEQKGAEESRREQEGARESRREQEGAEGGRRDFLAKASWGLAAVPYGMVANGMYRTLYDHEVVNVEIKMPHLPRSMDGIRIAQLSDIHAGSYVDDGPFQEVRRRLEQIKPDLIVITGDWVNSRPQELKLIYKELGKLRAPEGVIGTLGNHDHYNSPSEHQDLIKAIRSLNIDLLINEHRRIGNGDASIILAGTDNTGFRQHFADINKTLHGVEGGEPVVLLSHDPTFWDKEIVDQRKVDLMLAGHTHGGQFGIRVMGFEWSPAAYIYEQYAGLYRKKDQLLYVNSGLGTVGPPLRIGVPPEITIFTLRAPSYLDNVA